MPYQLHCSPPATLELDALEILDDVLDGRADDVLVTTELDVRDDEVLVAATDELVEVAMLDEVAIEVATLEDVAMLDELPPSPLVPE